jgi:hypothetical protein
MRRPGQPVWGDTLQTYPLADVTKLEVRQTDGLRTFGLAVGIGAALFTVAAMIALSDGLFSE